MSTVAEIESAAKQLATVDRQRLLLAIAQSLRVPEESLPPPRVFSADQSHDWIAGDDEAMKKLRRETRTQLNATKLARKSAPPRVL